MRREKRAALHGFNCVADLKKNILANAVATGNSFAFQDLFAWLNEFPEIQDDSSVDSKLLARFRYLLPTDEMVESLAFRDALKTVETSSMMAGMIPATALEQTASEAVSRGKFAYAEDAYRLLGIKKEMVALFAQAGEQLLKENKPEQAATAFFIAASIDQPIGPQYQYLGWRLHTQCLRSPEKCTTALPIESLLDAGIRFLLSHEPLAERLLGSVRPDQKQHVLAILALWRDLDFSGLLVKLREAVAELDKVENGDVIQHVSIASILLGRSMEEARPSQYLREFCFEHPVGALCVCVRYIRHKPVLLPVLRNGKSIIEELLPQKFLNL